MFLRAKEKFISQLRKDYLHLTDMKIVKKMIEDRGYSTSRIYGTKNVKRLTATKEDKTRLEFLLSEKNMFIAISPSFSNRLSIDIEIIARNENEEEMNEIKNSYSFNNVYESIYFSNRVSHFYKEVPEINPIHLFFARKNLGLNSEMVRNMSAVNDMAEIRDKIINLELNRDKLPLLSEIKPRAKETLIKNISYETIEVLGNYLTNFSENPTVMVLENKDFYNGFVFYKYIYFKYQFSNEDLEKFFDENIPKYIFKHMDEIKKKYEKFYFYDYLKGIESDFFSDLKKPISGRRRFKLIQEELNTLQEESRNEFAEMAF